MREKFKSRKIRVILVGSILLVVTIVCIIILQDKKTDKTMGMVDKDDRVISDVKLKEDKNSLEKVEDEGEESTTEEVKSEVSNTPKVEEKKEPIKQKEKKTNTKNDNQVNNSTEQQSQQPKQEVNNNSNNSSNSNSQAQPEQTNTENTDLYNSITHGQWETDISDSSSLCEAKGNKIANNELIAILDWNELHEDEQKQPIINYSRCYPVIKDGIKHWYLHFFTTQGEGMDIELKNKYNF